MKIGILPDERRPRWVISIIARTLGAVLVMLAGFGFAVSIYMRAFTEDIYSTRKQGMESIVLLAKNVLEPVIDEKNAGRITLGDARIRATEIIEQFVYDSHGISNYVFFASYEGYVLVEPPLPEAVGTYQMQRKDAYGTPITKQLLAKARSGGGFVEYYESSGQGEKPRKKLTYVIGIPEIECYLGTGVFVDDIDRSINELHKKLMLLGILIILAVIALQYYCMRPLLSYLYWLFGALRKWVENPDSVHHLDLPTELKNMDSQRLHDNMKNMLISVGNYRQTAEERVESFRQVACAASDVIWEWDSQRQTTIWSGSMKNIIGYEPEGHEAHFEVIEDWVHPDDRKTRRRALAAYFSGTGKAYICEYRLFDKAQEEYRLVLARGVATFDHNRSPIRMVGSIIAIPAYGQLAFNQWSAGEESAYELTGVKAIRDIVQKMPFINGDMLVIDVKRRLDYEQWQGVVVVEDSKPIGLVMRDALNNQLSGQYGASLYYGKPVKMIMDGQPLIIDAGLSLEQVASAARNRPEAKLYDLIVVTENGNYLGTVSVMELLSHITDLRVQLAANANPLTGLPGNLVIEERIKQALLHDFAALYIDLDNFKAFNDKYGFEMGDKAIKLTATILKESVSKVVGERSAFLGHIGGDDFLVLLYKPELAVRLAEIIIEEFDARILTLYLPEDLSKGFIAVPDRKGNMERYSVMSISVAIVDNLNYRFQNHLEVSEVAAQLKSRAKMVTRSTWVSDRRGAK